jgi:hypothetical protein
MDEEVLVDRPSFFHLGLLRHLLVQFHLEQQLVQVLTQR